MKIFAYATLITWICVAATYFATLTVMNKIRIEDSAVDAYDTIRDLIPIMELLKEEKFDEAREQVEELLEYKIHRAEACDYDACNRETPPAVRKVIQEARDVLPTVRHP